MNKCIGCNSNNIELREVIGRVNSPKGHVKKLGDNRRISWKGYWNIFTCLDCGKVLKSIKNA